MTLSPLTAISPIDGRYRKYSHDLALFFSEFALIKFRIYVEIGQFIALCELPLPQLEKFDPIYFPKLRAIYENFEIKDAEAIKRIEQTTNHDVKAVEYFIKDQFDELSIGEF